MVLNVRIKQNHIVSEVIEAYGTWSGESSRSWVGFITANDKYLTCRKYQKRTETSYMQCEGDNAVYYLLSGDVRIVFKKHKKIEPVNRARRKSMPIATTTPISYQFEEDEMEELKNSVYIPTRGY